MQTIKNSLLGLVLMISIFSCGSQKDTTENLEKPQSERGKKGRPSLDDIFKMDLDNDGLISKEEVKGPLQRDFDKIDSDGNGFLNREEVENAPKPQRGQRGRR